MAQVGKPIIKEAVKGFTPLYQDAPVVAERRDSQAELLEKESALRYSHLPESELRVLDSILRGWHPLSTLPKLTARVVRVFISSTFTDTTLERNALMARAYPLLRAYCRERHGLEFQVVDMRWGVQQGARDDHSTTDLCLEEIAMSQRDSVGPNFVAFMGQKYGFIDLPQKLPHDQYEPIRAEITKVKADEDIDFLDTWYKKDTNSTPTTFVLQPISSVLGSDYSNWTKISERLQTLLLIGVKAATESGKLEESVMKGLKASVTEQELDAGIFSDPNADRRDSNVLCFTRTIDDLEKHLDRSKVGRFIDLLPKTIQVDLEKKEAVTLLKDKMKGLLGKENWIEYNVNWSDPNGMDEKVHEEYLTAVNDTFYGRMRALIDANVQRSLGQAKDELYDEVLQQWDLARIRCQDFLGREDILEGVSKYLLEETDQPLVIHGYSGYGKTSIVAKAASEITAFLQQDGLSTIPYVVVRFCGTSPASSNVRQLLQSLCHQLAYCTDKYRHQVPKDFKLLKAYFKDILQKGDFPGIVVILLDALNQLSAQDNAHKLDWLPSKLARNVKVIVTSITAENAIYQKLCSKITNRRYYIEVKEMSAQLCGEILNSSLQKRGRIINFNQWRLVRETFNKCALPLFAKLTFEEVLTWKSYMDIPKDALATSVSACIHQLFDRLEEKHGKTMVRHALGYITASQGGISEAEMEDILSIDDTVLNSVFTFWEPPLRRIPPILFPRIKQDIAGYLVERECDETTVMYWYHQQFIEAATKRYLADSNLLRELHSNMADYFLGTWSGTKKKSFLYAPFLAKRMRLNVMSSSAVRYVPKQPLVYDTYNTSHRYNFRKINQMPYHLAQAGRSADLNKQVFFNFEFLHIKLKACSVQRLISDFGLSKERDVCLVADALRMSEAALAMDADVLGLEISGRLLPHAKQYDTIKGLIRQCDIAALQRCPVVPNWQVFTAPGGPLQYVCEADATIQSDIDVELVQNEDTVFLMAKPFHGTRMRIWDISQGEPQPDLVLPAKSRSYSSPNGVYVNLFKNNRSLQTFRMDSGEMFGEVEFGHANIKQVEAANKYVAFTFEQATSPVVIDIEAHMLVHRFQYQARAVGISRDERYLVTNNGRVITVHSFPMMERKCLIETSNIPEKILFSSDNSKFYIQDSGHELKCFRINYAQRRGKATGIVRDIEMKAFKLSHSENMILVRSSRCLYVFDTIKEAISHRITSMPSGVFIERLSTFKDAGFTPNDELIVAARHIYLGVWSAKTGQPIRLLQSSVSPVAGLFTSDTVNRAITLLQDHSLQVWNLDNLDADVHHLNAIIKGSIKAMSSAQQGHRVICCGKEHAEGRILNLNNNECEWTLEHTEEIGRQLDNVIMSPCGKFAITRLENGDVPEFLEPWKHLKEDKLWDLQYGKVMQTVTSSRHAVFSPNDDKVCFFICKNYSTYDWGIISYDLLVTGLTGEHARETYLIGLPDGDVVGKPVITESGLFLAFLLQSKYSTQLIVYSFEKLWRGLKYLDLKDLWSGFVETDLFLDLQLFNNDSVLVTYGHKLKHFTHLPDGTLDRNKHIYKASFLYDLKNDNMISRLDKFLLPGTIMDKIFLSSKRSYILDHSGHYISTIDNELVNTLDLSDILPHCICLVLDGRYVAMLLSNRRELVIMRGNDGVRKARVFLHGVADHLQVAQNDHTLLVGSRDGRVMSFSVILETADPMQEIINLLPSRKEAVTQKTSSVNGHGDMNGFSLSGKAMTLKSDIKNIQNTHNMQKRLSTITRAHIMDQKRKHSSFKAVGQAVLITQELNRVKHSQSCVLQ